MTEAVLYGAKSTKDPRGSIPTQLADGRAEAEKEGWAVVAEYKDENKTAWRGDRGPGLTEAMAHAERIGGVLIVQHSDRLARGDAKQARHLVEIALWAMKAGVTIRCIQDPTTFENLTMAVIMGDRNSEDSRRKSEAVKAGMKRRREKGLHHGGPRSFGLDYEDGKQVPVEAEAVIVKRIFAEYLAGTAQLQITRNLRADGVHTTRGGQWHQGTVRGILANHAYVETGIIDPGTWEKVKQLREVRARTTGRGRPPAGRHLFRKGMLRDECGAAMVPRTDPNRKAAPSETYVCYGRKQDPDSCDSPPIKRELIDSAVFNYFEQVALDVDATRQTIATARDRRLAEVVALRKEAEKEAKLADEALARVKRDYQRGAIEADDWADQRPQLAEEAEAARAEADRLRASEAEVERDGGLDDAEQQLLDYLTEIRRAIAGEVRNAEGIAAVRAALSRLFEGFIVHRSLPEKAHVELVGEVWLEPVVREAAVEGYTESMTPILRPTALETGENKYPVALTR